MIIYGSISSIRLGCNIALKRLIMSYRDSETKENVRTQQRKQRRGNDRKATVKSKDKLTKKAEAAVLCLISYLHPFRLEWLKTE